MRDFIADHLLALSSLLHAASVKCKDAALWVLLRRWKEKNQ